MYNTTDSTRPPSRNSRFLSLSVLPDDVLLDRVQKLAAIERSTTAELVAHLGEVEARRLYLGLGCPSMAAYCIEVLHLSESCTFARIGVARAARRFPGLIDRLADGSLSLTAARRLAPVLSPENCERLFDEARHKTKEQVEELVAREQPKPDAAPTIRRLPGARQLVPEPVETENPPSSSVVNLFTDARAVAVAQSPAVVAPQDRNDRERSRSSIAPTAPERYKVQFTAGAEMRQRIRHAQDLLRHQIPDGDLATVFDLALIQLVARLEQRKCGAKRQTRRGVEDSAPLSTVPRTVPRSVPRSVGRGVGRAIPRPVLREVWKRDGAQCAFVSGAGRRCSATGWLEFHHVHAFARGGETTTANIELRCRAHNAYEAEREGLGWRRERGG